MTPKHLNYEGPNSDLVQEVLDFAFSTRVLSGAAATNDSITITTDMVRAVNAAGFASDESKINVGYGSGKILLPETWPYDGEVEWIATEGWGNLRVDLGLAYIQTKGWYAWSKMHKSEIDKFLSLTLKWNEDTPMPLLYHLESRLPEGPIAPNGRIGYYRNYIVHEVASDLVEICKNRAFNGMTDNFWEQLFSMYSAGYWPCCWLGSWPTEGNFLVWNPKDVT